ncbi:MAG TPA: rhomboid family intramembrane serine protease [Candidatus Limnocylindrales bacterium]|nr:rhomboid family intramembrane serine protease [Candidatus Limnocylindrales bacterium]
MIPLRDANPTRRRPIVTIGLIAICVIAFAYELGAQATGGDDALERLFADWALIPAHLTAALGGTGATPQWVAGGDPARQLFTIVTSMFLHGGWIHLIGNMLYLWIFGNNVEDRFGRLGYLGFYLLGGIVAAGAQVFIDPRSEVPVIGASGAIAAVLGAYLVLYPGARVLSLVFLGFFYQLLQVPAVIVLGLWFVLQLIDGLTSLGVPNASTGVALFEHIGGFAAGALVALVLRGAGRRGLARPPEPPSGSRVG